VTDASSDRAAKRRDRIEKLRERRLRHKQRHLLVRVAVGLFGAVLILAGLLLSLPGVPGPGLVLVGIGVGILALEFDRAERILDSLLKRIDDARDRADRASRLQRYAGGAAIVALGVAVLVAFALFDVPVLPG
jgi:uncharacterized protein (TIGR02611 family)